MFLPRQIGLTYGEIDPALAVPTESFVISGLRHDIWNQNLWRYDNFWLLTLMMLRGLCPHLVKRMLNEFRFETTLPA